MGIMGADGAGRLGLNAALPPALVAALLRLP
jgi:hypothetical protein